LNILLTNDDGIYAEGILVLARILIKDGHQVIIVAPDRERSAAGHSITILDPLRANKVYLDIDNLQAYKVNGTPADCVKLGLEKLVDFNTDLVISGINDGPNIGYDVLYSGTVSAAMEGFMMGYTSISVSLDNRKSNYFSSGAKFIKNFIKDIISAVNDIMLLNINIPGLPESDIKGMAYTRLGDSQYEDSFEERIAPNGKKYFWLTGYINEDNISEDTDIWALKHNKISITPLKLNLTDLDKLELLKGKLKE
jgi:5'-nucleotidase